MTLPTREAFAVFLERLYQQEYTGGVFLHFGQGIPSRAEIPREPMQIVFDKPKAPRASLTR